MQKQSDSLKWISINSSLKGPQLTVNSKVKEEVFKNLSKEKCNMISIFGAARQGKSFLMNCLAGQTGLFTISNQRESCTQGIDISRKMLNLSEFSEIDGGTRNSTSMRIGFVDAEGQGDRDVTYDANLVCPILLVSKCVIFNWKDSMQKDKILNQLGIMHKAAISVAVEGSLETGSTAVFGHLHLVFRDWQYGGSDEASVKNDIFKEERSGETAAAVRNQIRRSIVESFESITVWLFPPPVASSNQLSTELSFSITTAEFKGKIRQLRNALSLQLTKPTHFNNKPLLGSSLCSLVETVSGVLNSGETISPLPAWISMTLSEVEAIRLREEKKVKKEVENILIDFKEESADPESSIFHNPQEAQNIIAKILTEFDESFEQEIFTSIGDLDDNLEDQLLSSAKESNMKTKKDLYVMFYMQVREYMKTWLTVYKNTMCDVLSQELEEGGGYVPLLPTKPDHLISILTKYTSSSDSCCGNYESFLSNLNEVYEVNDVTIMVPIRPAELPTNMYADIDVHIRDTLTTTNNYMQQYVGALTSRNASIITDLDLACDAHLKQSSALLLRHVSDHVVKNIRAANDYTDLKSFKHYVKNLERKVAEIQKYLEASIAESFQQIWRSKGVSSPQALATALQSNDLYADYCKNYEIKYVDHFSNVILLELQKEYRDKMSVFCKDMCTNCLNDINTQMQEIINSENVDVSIRSDEWLRKEFNSVLDSDIYACKEIMSQLWELPPKEMDALISDNITSHANRMLESMLFTNRKMVDMQVKMKESDHHRAQQQLQLEARRREEQAEAEARAREREKERLQEVERERKREEEEMAERKKKARVTAAKVSDVESAADRRRTLVLPSNHSSGSDSATWILASEGASEYNMSISMEVDSSAGYHSADDGEEEGEDAMQNYKIGSGEIKEPQSSSSQTTLSKKELRQQQLRKAQEWAKEQKRLKMEVNSLPAAPVKEKPKGGKRAKGTSSVTTEEVQEQMRELVKKREEEVVKDIANNRKSTKARTSGASSIGDETLDEVESKKRPRK